MFMPPGLQEFRMENVRIIKTDQNSKSSSSSSSSYDSYGYGYGYSNYSNFSSSEMQPRNDNEKKLGDLMEGFLKELMPEKMNKKLAEQNNSYSSSSSPNKDSQPKMTNGSFCSNFSEKLKKLIIQGCDFINPIHIEDVGKSGKLKNLKILKLEERLMKAITFTNPKSKL